MSVLDILLRDNYYGPWIFLVSADMHASAVEKLRELTREMQGSEELEELRMDHIDTAINLYTSAIGYEGSQLIEVPSGLFLEAYEHRGAMLANKGQIESNSGLLEEAIQDFTHVIETGSSLMKQGPQYGIRRTITELVTEALKNRTNASVRLKRYDAAIEDLTLLLTKFSPLPLDRDLYADRGTAYSETRQFDKAICDFTSALPLSGNVALHEILGSRAYAYIRIGEYDKAIADLERALTIEPSSPPLISSMGLVKQLLGEPEEAKQYYEKVLEIVKVKPMEERTVIDYMAAIESETGLLSLGQGISTQFEREAIEGSKVIPEGIAYVKEPFLQLA